MTEFPVRASPASVLRMVGKTMLAAGAFFPSQLWSQTSVTPASTIPIPPALRSAYESATRDLSGRPGRRYWQLRADYVIQASLDTTTSVISGRERILVFNTSPVALTTIQVRLDANLFRPGAPSDAALPSQTQGMIVTRLVLDGRRASIGGPQQEYPGGWLSGTIGTSERITLGKALKPGEVLAIELDWNTEIPSDENGANARTGRWGNRVYQVGQWYPRIAMFDDLGGWDTLPYLGESEFFNPYGRFDVRLEVPAGWLVGATGELMNATQVLTPVILARLAHIPDSGSTLAIVGPADRGPGKATLSGDRLVWHFVADSVSDFAWGASGEYVWNATRVTIPGRGAIPIHFLITDRHAGGYDSAAIKVRHALSFNSRLIMPYAYPQFTLLDGPEGGMEYPMLTMSHGAGIGHEVWHQWWPMMVGTDETRFAFMDEGFSNFLAAITAADREGRAPTLRASGGQGGARALMDSTQGAPTVPNVASYGKPSRMFSALGEIVGRGEVLRALGEFARTWRFKHPSPWDFMYFMNHALRRDLNAFWYTWLFTGG